MTCTCAVIVQSGDDVVVFDRCNPVTDGAVDVRLYLNDQLSENTQVMQFADGGKYRVNNLLVTFLVSDGS